MSRDSPRNGAFEHRRGGAVVVGAPHALVMGGYARLAGPLASTGGRWRWTKRECGSLTAGSETKPTREFRAFSSTRWRSVEVSWNYKSKIMGGINSYFPPVIPPRWKKTLTVNETTVGIFSKGWTNKICMKNSSRNSLFFGKGVVRKEAFIFLPTSLCACCLDFVSFSLHRVTFRFLILVR